MKTLLLAFVLQFSVCIYGYPYIYHGVRMQWQEAKDYCVSIGSSIADPYTMAMNTAVQQACLSGGAPYCWINMRKHWQYEQYSCGPHGNCPLLPGQWCGGTPDGVVGFIVSSTGCWGLHFEGPSWTHEVVCNPIPTVSPTPAPTDVPTLSPTMDCEGRGEIEHINWDNLLNSNNITQVNNIKSGLLSVINVHTDHVSLDTTINVELGYLGSSSAAFNNGNIELGTTYIIDFKSFDGNQDSIDEPGNCQNRRHESFVLVNKVDWWTYSDLPYGTNQLGNDNFLAYPSLPSYWSIQNKIADSCQPILYSGYFSLDDLLGCEDYNGNKLYELSETSDDITLKWILHVDIVSPRLNSNDNDIYRVYPLDKHHIIMTFTKSNDIISSTLSQQLFFITIDSLSITGHVIDIIFYTESADYVFLTNPILISSPLSNYQHTITSLTNTNCILSTSYTCGQRWKLAITNYMECPVTDLSGDYMIKFDAKCDNTTSVCNEFLSNNNGSDVLLISYSNYENTLCESSSIDITLYTDQQFYISNGFNQQQNIYGIGYPLYVEIISQIVNNSQIPTQPFSNILAVEINNVYVCNPMPSNNIIASCLTSSIDSNGPFHIISNGVANSNYNAQIIKSGFDNKVRFSFNIFETGSISQQLYIHSQILLTIQAGEATRRILLDNIQTAESTEFNQLEFVIKSTTITSSDEINPNTNEKTIKNNIIIWIIAGCIFMVLMLTILILVYKLNSKNTKLKPQIQDDQVNASETAQIEVGEETIAKFAK